MSLIKWEPFRDMDEFFGDNFFNLGRDAKKYGWDLAVDVYEENNNIIAEMNIPGVNPEKIDVDIQDDYLRVSGSREEKQEKKEKDHYSKEIVRGSFERLINLPKNVDAGKAEAEYKKGVLKITLPKKTEEKKEKVKIKIN